MKKIYRVTTLHEGSVLNREEFPTIKSLINHMIKEEKLEAISKIMDKVNKKIEQAERKTDEDVRHYSAVKEGLEEALAIVEKAWS